MQSIDDIFAKYGFLSSVRNHPPFTVPNPDNPNESLRIDYWHPNKDCVIHIHKYRNEGESEKEGYLILQRNGYIIKQLYDYSSVSDFFHNDNWFINAPQTPTLPQFNNYQSQNPPQQFSPIQNQQNYSYPHQYPPLLFDINSFLNSSQLTNYLNLQNIIPSNHVIHKMATYLHNEHPLPISTLILVGLGVASAMTTRKWNCAYIKKGTAPICLYVVAEQKKGRGKSFALNTFQEPLCNIINEYIKKIKCIIEIQENELNQHLAKEADDSSKEYKDKFKLKTKQLKEQVQSSKNKLSNAYALLPKTKATTEALEESLNNTNGFFIVTADEQSLIDTLITGKQTKSNDILLCGRNAGLLNSSFISRKGYTGRVTGSFVCFSQEGCIEKIMRASGATGLCERFLMISEPELLDRLYQGELLNNNNPPQVDNDQELFDEYASKFNFLKDVFEKPLEYDKLIALKISNNGWHDIKMFQNDLIKNKQNGYLSHEMLSTMADKADMQIMSIASNLYLLDLDDKTQPSIHGEHYIPNNYIKMAIDVTRELIIGVRQYCEANGIIGNKEQIEVIMNCFFDKKQRKYVSLSLEQIKHKCEQVNPFLNLPQNTRRPIIVDLLNKLHRDNIVLLNDGLYFINPLTQHSSHMMSNYEV